MKRLTYFSALILFSNLIYALDLVTHDEINFIPKPIITFPESISGISWSENNYFALSEKKFVCFSINDDLGEQMIASPGGDVRYIKFVKPNTPPLDLEDEVSADDILIVLTENNVLGMKTFSSTSENYLLTKVYDPDLEISAIDFSPEGNRILLGLATGEVRLMIPTYIENDIVEYTLDDHTGNVYSVSFSNDGRYFLSASKDGYINIYSRDKETKKLFTMKSESNYDYPVCFSPDSRFVVSVKQKRNILFRDFAGNLIQEIKTDRNVKDYQMSTTSEYLFVLGENSLIYIYDINSGEKLGYIPPFNKYPITQFAFNKTETRLIVGHSDGSVYYLKSEEVILDPNAKAPKLGQGVSVVSGGGGGFDSRNAHTIELRASVYPEQKPYMLQGSAMLGYTNGKLISPFYFGIFAKVQVAIPNAEDFPSKYYYHDQELPNPFLDSAGFVIPLGIALRPFGNDIEFFMELDLGGMLYTFQFPKYGFVGKVFPSFFSEVTLGLGWKFVSLFVGAGYDLRTGFLLNGGLGFEIEVGRD